MALIGPGGQLTQAIGQIDAALDEMALRQSGKDVLSAEQELPDAVVRRAGLEPAAWGQEFEATGRLTTAYGNAQGSVESTLRAMRAHLVHFAERLQQAQEDYNRVDDESGRDVARTAELLQGQGNAERVQRAYEETQQAQQVRQAQQQGPAAAGGE